MKASVSQVAAVVALVTGIPLGLGGLSNLRFEMVRLVLREDNVCFFCFTNLVTQVLNGIMYGDLRALVVIVDFLGITNIVFIDARLRGVRRLTQLSILGLFSVASLLCCILLDQIDQTHGASLWQYKAGSTVYDVSVSDYVVNGYSTIGVLLAKIIYRKRQSMRRATRSSVIECAIFRCHTKLAPMGSADSKIERQNSSALILNGVGPGGIKSTTRLQQLQYVRPDCAYDARKIMFPVRISSKRAFPWGLLIVLYLMGIVGFVLLSVLCCDMYSENESIMSTEQTVGKYGTAAICSFVCSTVFCSIFFAFYQRDLLVSLLASFDFVFYSLQVTAVHSIAAALCGLCPTNCLWLTTSWIWHQWVLCLDALTPAVKTKLSFHVHYAVPVVALMLIGHLALIGGAIFTRMDIMEDRATWQICIGGQCVQFRILPALMGRLMILATWMLRLLVRLVCASNADATILRGAVTYENYMSDIEKFGSRVRSISRRETWGNGGSRLSVTTNSGYSSKIG